MRLPKSNNEDFEPPPSGSHAGICYSVVDLGTQDGSYQGKPTRSRKVELHFELHGEECKMKDGRPLSVKGRYTFSTSPKSRLRKDLERWRDKKFIESDFGPGGFEMTRLLGQPVLISIEHNETEGKVYANVTSLAKLPKEMKALLGTQHNPNRLLSLEEGEFDQEVFDALPEWMQESIKKSPEWAELSGGKPAAKKAGKKFDEEIPF